MDFLLLSQEAPPVPRPSPESFTAAVVGIAIFLIISTGIGFYMMRKARTYEEWLVGHRDIGPVVTGFALVATWLSGWAIFGNAGLSYTYGWSGGWLIGMMNIMGIAICAVLGYRMRRYAELGARTVPEVLRVRFESRVAQSLAAIAMIILLIVYSVGQFKAMATVWMATTGSPWLWSVLAAAILVFVYMAVGGYAGTQYALFFQGVLLTITSWGIGIAALAWAGPANIVSRLMTDTFVAPGGKVTPLSLGGYTLPLHELVGPKGLAYPGADWLGASAVIFMFLFMATGFPHNIARFLGVRKVERREFWILMACVIIGSTSPLWVGVQGLAARAFWGGALMSKEFAPMYGDAAAIEIALAMGPGVAGLLAAGVFAAAVATLAGMVMIMAANVTRDLIYIYKPDISPRALLWATRILLIPFIFLPFYWTVTAPPPVLAEFMSGAAVGQAGIFFTVVAISMYWKRATKWGAIAAIIYGIILTLFHPKVFGPTVGLFHWGIWAMLTIFGCMLVYFVFSLVTKPLPPEKLERLSAPRAA